MINNINNNMENNLLFKNNLSLIIIISFLVFYTFINNILSWIYSLFDIIIFVILPLIRAIFLILSNKSYNHRPKKQDSSEITKLNPEKSLLGTIMLSFIIKILLIIINILSFIPIISYITLPLIIILMLLAVVIQIPLGLFNLLLINMLKKYNFINVDTIMCDNSPSDIIIIYIKNIFCQYATIIDEIGYYLNKFNKKKFKFNNNDKNNLIIMFNELKTKMENIISFRIINKIREIIMGYINNIIYYLNIFYEKNIMDIKKCISDLVYYINDMFK